MFIKYTIFHMKYWKTPIFLKMWTTVILLLSVLDAQAIGMKNQVDYKSCFRLSGNIEQGKVSPEETFWVQTSATDIFAYQWGTQLSILPPTKKESKVMDYKINLEGNTQLLKDDDFFTTLSINPEINNEILVTFDKKVSGGDFYFVMSQSSNFYLPKFYISEDGENFGLIDHYRIKDYSFKYVKIVFEPKPDKTAKQKEVIYIGEIMFKENISTFAVKAISRDPVDIYSQYDCDTHVPNVNIEPLLKLKKTSQIFPMTLISTWGKILIPQKIEKFSTPSPTVNKKFPSIDKIVATIFVCLLLLTIALYIRYNARSKEFWLLPQKMVSPQKKPVFKQITSFFRKKWKNIKKISSSGIESINFLIKGKKKKEVIKSKKLIKVMKEVLSHYEENKNTFFPGELKSIYLDVVNSLKEDLSKKTHKKAVDIIHEFVEKWGKLVINMKKKK